MVGALQRVVNARHAMHVVSFALAFDELYTIVFWLILDRDARRAGPHAELKYFGIIGQLAVETTIILYLYKEIRRMDSDRDRSSTPQTSTRAL